MHFFSIKEQGMRNRTCCFTGHRELPTNDEYKKLKNELKKSIIDLIENHNIIYFGNGGALGFDILAAQIILELKIDYPNIKLIMVLPCREQDKYWNDSDKIVYHRVLEKSDKVVYVSENYTRGCMFKRNRHLIDNSSYCVCYLRKKQGGTYYTYNYGVQKNINLIML